MLYVCIAFAIIVPYLICSINPAIIVAKLKSGKDIRELGSGNPGLTNTLRTMGKSAAATVLLFDVLKGAISIFAIMLFYSFINKNIIIIPTVGAVIGGIIVTEALYLCMWIGSLFAVLGHCFPIFYKFKGGKAALVTVASGLVINWLAALIALTLFILIVAITRYVSLGSMISAVLYVVAVGLTEVFLWDNPAWYIGVIFCGSIALIIVLKHSENIKRLLNGTEKKLGKREKIDG